MFSSFKNKKIIITGHTGFKGAWLTLWLTILGAKVVGLALRPHTNPSLFNALNIENDIQNINIDIRDAHKLAAIFETIQPDFVFHLAAQSLVIKSYEDPLNTWTTNLIGTISVLEGLRKSPEIALYNSSTSSMAAPLVKSLVISR
jgi:CDP-glucose 4,6-dehydratase